MADEKKPTKAYVLHNSSMYIDGEDRNHGDTVHLEEKRGDALAEQGVVLSQADWARRDDDSDGDDKAQADARDAVAVIEESKVRAAEEARLGQSAPLVINRGAAARRDSSRTDGDTSRDHRADTPATARRSRHTSDEG